MKKVNIQIKAQVLTPEEFFNFVITMGIVKAYRLYNTSINSKSLSEIVEREIERGHFNHYKSGTTKFGNEIIEWTYWPADYSATKEQFTKEWEGDSVRPLNNAFGDLFLIAPSI